MNLSTESQILLEVRRKFGAGRSLFISHNQHLEAFKRATHNPNTSIRELCKLAEKDIGLLARLTESSNATKKFKTASRNTPPLEAVNRLGISGCRGVIYNYIFEQSNLNLSKPWLRVFQQINSCSGEALRHCFQVAEEEGQLRLAYDAFQISLLLTLSCHAKIVGANNRGLTVTNNIKHYVSNPDLLIAEMIATYIGLNDSALFTATEGEAYTACSIAKQAWEKVNKRVIENDVLSYKFKPDRIEQ